MRSILSHRHAVTCQPAGTVVASPHGGLRRGPGGLGDQHADRGRAPRSGRVEGVRPRALRPARRRDPDRGRLHAARLHARGAELVAPALRAPLPTRARRRAARARPRVRQHRLPTATAFPDGSAMFLQTSLEANVTEFDRCAAGDGAAWQRQFEEFMANADVSFGVLGTELWSSAGLGLGQRMLRRFGRRGLLDFTGHAGDVPRLDDRDLPVAGAGPRPARAVGPAHRARPGDAVSGFMTQVIACAVQLGGMPVPGRRRRQLVDALAGIVRDAGGELRTDADVERISSRRAARPGVVLGRRGRRRARAVVAGVTPTQLYGRSCGRRRLPPDVTEAAAATATGGRACRSTSRWTSRRAGRAPRRRAPRPDGDRPRHARGSTASRGGERGRARAAPAEATIVAGQPCAVDRRRAPRGQVDRLDPAPGASRRAGEGRCRGRARRRRRDLDGDAPRGLRRPDRRPARRVDREPRHRRPEAHRPLPGRPRGAQPNLVAGDIYAGSCALDQNLLWRPFAASPGHRTTVEGLWHVGASTHPGPGLGAGPATSSRRSSRSRRCLGGSLQSFQDAREAVPSAISTVNASFARTM